MEIDPKNPVWWALGGGVVIVGFLVHWMMTRDDSRREAHVVFGAGVVDCDTVRADPNRVELRAWLAANEDRTVMRFPHTRSVKVVDDIYGKGAAEVLVGAFDPPPAEDPESAADQDAGDDAGPRPPPGPINVRAYVIVPPADPGARRDFLEAWGGTEAMAENQHQRCMVVGGG